MSEAATRAAKGRRKAGRQEWTEQTQLAQLLAEYLDPSCTFATALENRPRSCLSGLMQKRRGTRSGLPDVMVIFIPIISHGGELRQRSVFVELKSWAGVASKAQKQVRVELVAVGCEWWLCRSARAALTALHRSGVPFRRPWRPGPLRP